MSILVEEPPPYLTVQDLGRSGFRAAGVPLSGAMDPCALSIANVLTGSSPGAPALEWALGGGTLRFQAAGVIALAGAVADAMLDGEPAPGRTTLAVRRGSRLEVGTLREGRFLYVAVAGGVRVPEVLGSASTYLPGGFGGAHGRLLRAGDRLGIGTAGQTPRPGFEVPPLLSPHDHGPLRVLSGPQDHLFHGAFDGLLHGTYTVSATSDRTGYRLEGPALRIDGAARLPSEPACPGAIQVPPLGQPIVLMPDGPTVGGYPKIAVVAGVDLGRLAQKGPGEQVRFAQISMERAQQAYRRKRVDLHTLAALATAEPPPS